MSLGSIATRALTNARAYGATRLPVGQANKLASHLDYLQLSSVSLKPAGPGKVAFKGARTLQDAVERIRGVLTPDGQVTALTRTVTPKSDRGLAGRRIVDEGTHRDPVLAKIARFKWW